MSLRETVRGAVRRLSDTPDNAVGGFLFDMAGGEFAVDGLRFEIPRELTTRRFRGRFYFGSYEGGERALVRSHVRPDATVLEVGGCLGVVSCETNRLLAEPAQHVVVEAHPGLVDVLRRNRDRNGARFAVAHGLLAADGDGDGDGTFHLHDLIVGGSAHRPTGRSTTVPVLRWGDLEARAGGPFDTLVLDMEGGECDLLRRNADRLAHVDIVVVEWHDFVVGEAAVAAAKDVLRAAGLHPVEQRGLVEAWTR